MSDHGPRAMAATWWRTGVVAAVVVSVLMRVRFLFSPLSSDEGGFLAIARAWRHGATLYRDVWVDRPQGLLVVYRLFATSGGTASTVRLIGIVFGAIGVFAVATLVRAVAGERAGLIAGFVAAAMSAAPAIEGFSANGELLSGAMSASAICLAIRSQRSPGSPRAGRAWMFAAGAVGAFGWSLKQSGADGLAAIGVWLVIVAAMGRVSRRAAMHWLAALVAGAALVFGGCVLHAALTEWHGWWYAVIGYRAQQRSALVGANWPRLWRTARESWLVWVPPVLAGVFAWMWQRWSGRRRQRELRGPADGAGGTLLLALWIVFAVLGFLSGGQFFHHYWVGLMFPLGAVVGLTVGRLRGGVLPFVLLQAVALAAVWSFASIAGVRSDDVPRRVSNESRPAIAEHVGKWLRTNKAPGDSGYMMCAAAHAYAYADMDPPYRYLWFDGVHQGEHAQAELEALFTGPHPPTWVAVFDQPKSCNRSGVVAQVLGERYSQVTSVDGVQVLHLHG